MVRGEICVLHLARQHQPQASLKERKKKEGGEVEGETEVITISGPANVVVHYTRMHSHVAAPGREACFGSCRICAEFFPKWLCEVGLPNFQVTLF